MLIKFDPANAHENGKPLPAFIPFVSGGSGDGYFNIGGWSRFVFRVSCTKARIRAFSTEATQVSSLPVTNTLIPYRVNGENRPGPLARLGDNWYDLHFGVRQGVSPLNKLVEIFVPMQNAVAFGGPPTGVYPIEIDFDGAATVVAPATSGPLRVIIGDSIFAAGMFARTALQSLPGLAKQGTSDAAHRLYRGNFDAGATYLPSQVGDDTGQIVAFTDGYTYEKTSSAPAGTTPAIGIDWKRRGFIGRVVTIGWGTRCWIDDIGSTSLINALVAQLVALGPYPAGSRIDCIRGVNDHARGIPVATIQAQITAFMNALGASSIGSVPCTLYGTTLAVNYEGANGLGETLDQMRGAISAGVTTSTHPNKNYVNLKSVLTSGDLLDQLHPGTVGHRKSYEVIG